MRSTPPAARPSRPRWAAARCSSLVDPVEVPAPIGGEEGVGDANFVDRHFGAGLHVQHLGQLEGAGVHVDGAHPDLVSPKAERRSGDLTGRGLIGHAALASGGRQRAQARVVDVGLAAAAAPNVAALALDDGPSPQQLAGRRREEAAHLPAAGPRRLRVAVHHETFLPALVEHVGLVLEVVDEPEAVGLPGGLLVHREELLLRQQGAQLLEDSLQLQLVPEPPDADELHVDANRRADQTQLLGRNPRAEGLGTVSNHETG